MAGSVTEVVALALRDGSLYGARPARATKTLTVEGKRRSRIRLQADIFNVVYGEQATPYYPDLLPLIRTEVKRQRA